MHISGQGAPKLNVFKLIDADGSKDITLAEVEAHFKKKDKPVPAGMFKSMDPDGDGIIQWEDFKGEKGYSKDEL